MTDEKDTVKEYYDKNSIIDEKLVKEGISLLKEKTKDPITGQEDKMMKYVDMAVKYAPHIAKVLQTITQNIRQPQQSNPMQRQIQPPEGWLSMSPLQRLAQKHKRPSWYEQGLRYENASDGSINPEINIDYSNPDARYLPKPPKNFPDKEPQSLQELSHKYPEPPLIDDAQPVQQDDEEDRVKRMESERPREEVKEPDKEGQEEQKIKEAQERMIQQNAQILGTIVNYINSQTKKNLASRLKDVEGLILMYDRFSFIIPETFKEMLRQTDDKQIKDMLKENCPDKYDVIEKNEKNVDKLLKQIREKL